MAESGGGAPPASFKVDVDALIELANHLKRVHDDLVGIGVHGAVDEAIFGDKALGRSVKNFVDTWSDGRKKIINEIASIEQVLRNAAEAYRTADDGLAAAARGEDPAGGRLQY